MSNWTFPEASLEEMLTMVKAFVDMVILASGYQTSGELAHWDTQNVKRAFHWATFLDHVLMRLGDFPDSEEELNNALSKLTSEPYFPQGIRLLSSNTLKRARSFILEHLIHTVPLRTTQLKSLVTATIEMDIEELQRTENNCLHLYLDKLRLRNTALKPVSYVRGSIDETVQSTKAERLGDFDFTNLSIQEIRRRHLGVSCSSLVATSMDIVSKITLEGNSSELDSSLLQEQPKRPIDSVVEEQPVSSTTWNKWRRKNLLYLFDTRTIRLVSGASMIFSAPKVQWVQVFERLEVSQKINADSHETIELLLLGCMSSRWNSLIEHFMSACFESLTVSSIYHEVHNLILGRYLNFNFKVGMKNPTEQCVLEHLEVLLSSQLLQLWKLPPILAAMSLPTWSQLFRLYTSELAGIFKGKSTIFRCCSCIEDKKEHIDCEVAERLWCLYVFHVRGSHICGTYAV